MDKKVSIIIPVYNTKPEYIQEAIDSALKQTYKNTEIIVVNDGSKDKETIEYLNNFKNENVKIVHQENKGLSSARNTGIENSTGEYILPLDSDDIIDSTYVEKAEKILSSNNKIGMVYSRVMLFGAQKGEWKLPKFNKETFIFENCVFCSALFRKTTWQEANKYKTDLRIGLEDWDLWLSFVELGYEPYQIPEILFYYRKHQNGSMIANIGSKLAIARKQIFNNHLKLYIKNEEAINRIFLNPESTGLKNIYKKLKKYKRLFNISLFANIITIILVIILTIIIIFKG